jgi:hypothetical protein
MLCRWCSACHLDKLLTADTTMMYTFKSAGHALTTPSPDNEVWIRRQIKQNCFDFKETVMATLDL